MNEPTGGAVASGTAGAELRSSREALGLRLEDVAATTRISRTYLEALEEGRYDRLPNAAYARGFLRSYSEFLHLDADRIVAMYDASLAPPAEPVPESTEVPPARPAMRRSKPLVAAAVAAVIVAGYLAGSRDEQPRHQGAPLQSQAPPQGVVATPASSAPAVPPAAPVPPQAPEVPAPPAVAAGRTVLTLSFTRDAHMVMNVDGEMPQEYEVRAGDVIEWEGERFFAVELSDGAAVEARLGGKPVKALGNGPVSVVLRTDGTTE